LSQCKILKKKKDFAQVFLIFDEFVSHLLKNEVRDSGEEGDWKMNLWNKKIKNETRDILGIISVRGCGTGN
jgi:hypothetical protein